MDNQYSEDFNSKELPYHLVVADGNVRTFGNRKNQGNFTGMYVNLCYILTVLHYVAANLGTNFIAGEHSIIKRTGDFAATISLSTVEELLNACKYEEKFDFCDLKYKAWLAVSNPEVIKEPTKRKADSEVCLS